jgi:N-acetylglucosaminyldiphosphoundecaprenol N-acetyl-beta-D-mannosaminyltransferase
MTLDPARAPASFDCCGVRIDALSPESARDVLARSAHGNPRAVHLCNAYTLSLALRDAAYRSVLNASDLNLADGQPVAFVGRRRGHAQMHSSVRGPGLMLDLLERGQETGLRHYFYGSTPEVCARITEVVGERFPAAKVVGIESPPFRPLDESEREELVARIRAARADIVWVGLGTPRQDRFLAEYRSRLDATLVAIGAGFDFLAGTKRVAPEWMQRMGLEWVFRLASEPRRLWKRYLVGNTLFVLGVLRDRQRSRK